MMCLESDNVEISANQDSGRLASRTSLVGEYRALDETIRALDSTGASDSRDLKVC